MPQILSTFDVQDNSVPLPKLLLHIACRQVEHLLLVKCLTNDNTIYEDLKVVIKIVRFFH